MTQEEGTVKYVNKYLNWSSPFNITEVLFEPEGMDQTTDLETDVVLWALIDGFLFLAIICGNILTIYAIVIGKTISRTISNRFLLSLAISDLIVGFMVLYHMAFYIHPHMGQIFGFCIVRILLISIACIASLFNILGIAIDRYIAIAHPLHYHKIITNRSAKLISLFGWTFSFTISMAILIWNKWDNRESTNRKCEMGVIIHPVYVMTTYVPMYIVLYSGMCAFYIRIIKETRKHAKRMHHLTKDRQSPWKSIQVLTLVLGSFTISYTPFVITIVLNSVFHKNTRAMSTVYKITYSLVVANSAVNPIIYAWKNQELKKSFWNTLRCKPINSPDENI